MTIENVLSSAGHVCNNIGNLVSANTMFAKKTIEKIEESVNKEQSRNNSLH